MAEVGGEPLLAVRDLSVTYASRGGDLRAVRDVSMDVGAGEIVGVVGESGCGKSTLSAAFLRLLPPNGRIVGGSIGFGGKDITSVGHEDMRRLRGRQIAMIFQDPLTSLNPTFTIGSQMRDAGLAHAAQGQGAADVRRRILHALAEVGISDPEQRLGEYPHQFSGGMRQRIMIATALLLEPALLIADEPTSALDVTLQAQIVSLLARLRRDHGTAILFVSHDLALVAQLCDRVVVMYAGLAVEQAGVVSLFDAPRHPYTQALLKAVPTRARRGERLATIPGRVPALSDLPPGCPFVDRCPEARQVCVGVEPRVLDPGGHEVRCHARDAESPYQGQTPLRDQAATSAGAHA